jgi:hypothetical protein
MAPQAIEIAQNRRENRAAGSQAPDTIIDQANSV